LRIITRGTTFGALCALAVLGASAPSIAAPKRGPAPVASSAPTAGAVAAPSAEPASIAIPKLQARLKANPNDKDALQQLAAYELDANRPDLAQALTQRLLALPGGKVAQTYYLDGVANEALQRYPQALQDLEAASDRDPTNAQVLLTLTELYLRQNRPTDAERVAKRATTFNSKDPRVFLNYGLVLGEAKRYDDARAQFEKAAALSPTDGTPNVLVARTYLDQRNVAGASAAFDRALAINPDTVEALIGKSRLLAQQRDVKGALALLDRLLGIVTSDDAKTGVLVEQANVYMSVKDTANAETVLKKAIGQYPTQPAGHLAYGDFLAQANRVSDAEAQWQAALGPQKTNRDALIRLGDAYLQTNHADTAQEMYLRLTQLNPQDAAAWAQLGQTYALQRRFDKAASAYKRSFGIARTPQALAGLGASDVQTRNFRESAQIFDALDKDAQSYLKANPQFLFIMGRAYEGAGQKTKAKSAYRRFLAFTKPGSPANASVKKLLAQLDGGTAGAAHPAAHR